MRAVRHATLIPDYHAEAPGDQPGGRFMVTAPFDARELGDHVKKLAPPIRELTVFGMMRGSGKKLRQFLRPFKSLESFWYVTKRSGFHLLDVVRHGRGMTLTNGNALAGRLAKAGMDLNVSVWLNSPVKSFIVENDVVVGATAVHQGPPKNFAFARVSFLACGGFRYDIERRKRLFLHAPTGRRALHTVASTEYR